MSVVSSDAKILQHSQAQLLLLQMRTGHHPKWTVIEFRANIKPEEIWESTMLRQWLCLAYGGTHVDAVDLLPQSFGLLFPSVL